MKSLIAANWKMNMDIKSSISFINNFKKYIKKIKNKEIVICPSFTLLNKINESTKNTKIKLGAQNMHFEEEGTFTGEISALMLKDVGCEYVILGHSERRQYFNETDDMVNKKIKTAFKNNLKPILCIGETLEQRNNNKTLKIIKNQLINCLKNIDENEIKNIVIAYEPIWAIGTGKNATPQQAEEVHKFIRELLSHIYNNKISSNVRIIYGGSIKESNIKDLMAMKNINGALVGGASLNPKSFACICGFNNST
ncbi:MAG: triose-phosphate isomerase [Nanoarchaeota archaeon]|nr:triose-phosphate isomerase [Nanoarchaeota archaeon]